VYKIASKAAGITRKDFQNGLDLYRAHNSWRLPIPDKGIGSSMVRHIGYVGADKKNALRYAEGKRRLPSERSARWGYGMYVADNPKV
jgi:magnesium-dependent phosphatase 1